MFASITPREFENAHPEIFVFHLKEGEEKPPFDRRLRMAKIRHLLTFAEAEQLEALQKKRFANCTETERLHFEDFKNARHFFDKTDETRLLEVKSKMVELTGDDKVQFDRFEAVLDYDGDYTGNVNYHFVDHRGQWVSTFGFRTLHALPAEFRQKREEEKLPPLSNDELVTIVQQFYVTRLAIVQDALRTNAENFSSEDFTNRALERLISTNFFCREHKQRVKEAIEDENFVVPMPPRERAVRHLEGRHRE